MPDFDEPPEFRALRRAARSRPDDSTPRLALADWLEEGGWAEEAAFYRSEVSAALWRLEDAARELPLADLLQPGNLPMIAAVCLLVDAMNKTAARLREAAAQLRAEQRRSDAQTPEPGNRPRKKTRRTV